MAESPAPVSGKKRRVIHWNPEAGQEPVKSPWTGKRILLWSVGGFFGLLFAVGIAVRLTRLVLGPDVFRPRSEVAAGAAEPADANSGYISETKAEFAHETSAKQLAGLRRLPTDHPVQLQRLILLEKNFQDGEALLRSREFSRAFLTFDSLNSGNRRLREKRQGAPGSPAGRWQHPGPHEGPGDCPRPFAGLAGSGDVERGGRAAASERG
jgi:hypothetical protein